LPLRPTLDFIYFDAGGGHRSAALALQSAIQAQGYNWTVRLVNLQEVLDPLDIFRKVTGVRLQDIYNALLAKGWTLGSAYMLCMMHAVIRIYHKSQVKLLTEYWRRQRPDMVISLVPNFNRALFESLRLAAPAVPFVTVLTDLADFPPHFWVERQPQYFICGTQRAAEQAHARSHPAARVFQVSGMILRPEFYRVPEIDVARERTRLGLRAELPTGLVLFGGEGSNTMFSIAERLGDSSLDLQLIMICGRNERLRQRVQNRKTKNSIYVQGFTKDVPYYMRISDFFIGKPGPGSISEAIKLNLPVIVERNSWTLPQERYNADWVREQGFGEVLTSYRGIEDAVRDLLANGRLQAMKERVSRMDNRAVYEVPPILERILATHGKDQPQNEVRISRESPATHASDNAGLVPGELADTDPSKS
jgi:UDP-N-acetylglucosamine:LPS N-acetylglucosamine transferase